nr:MAG TPA: hypothetical protein [Caudoviricetes sp.]
MVEESVGETSIVKGIKKPFLLYPFYQKVR